MSSGAGILKENNCLLGASKKDSFVERDGLVGVAVTTLELIQKYD